MKSLISTKNLMKLSTGMGPDLINDLLRACPHHGFSELHQLDTFYNALNSNDQDSLNSTASGNFLDKMPRDCLRIIESKSKVRNSRNKPVVAKVSLRTSTPGISPDVAELKDMVKALLLEKKNQTQAPTPVKAVEESCVTCGGTHSYRNCPTTDGNVYRDNIQEYVSQAAAANFNQGKSGYRAPIANQIRPPDDIKTDLGEFTSVVEKNIFDLSSTKDSTSIELNDFPILLSAYDSSLSKEFFEIDLLVSFRSGNNDKIFDPGILIFKGVQSQSFHILSLNKFSTILIVRDSLLLNDPSEIETFLSFPFGNENKVFDPGILIIDGRNFIDDRIFGQFSPQGQLNSGFARIMKILVLVVLSITRSSILRMLIFGNPISEI
ncbi:hypothetical protein Tco_0772107 [Tanacetum coccineum]|uniref:Reverse transcriptase domain-containing protein n=1 Tax=Tanacetum coccineum TaxID=301880 RepID=A0ABQ4ZIZ5_9ASTR